MPKLYWESSEGLPGRFPHSRRARLCLTSAAALIAVVVARPIIMRFAAGGARASHEPPVATSSGEITPAGISSGAAMSENGTLDYVGPGLRPRTRPLIKPGPPHIVLTPYAQKLWNEGVIVAASGPASPEGQ